MSLEDSFEAISPCIIGFISKLQSSRVGQTPIFPFIFGTGFLVDGCGIAVTNRHVVEYFDKAPRSPKKGDSPVAAFMFLPGDAGKSTQFLSLELKKWGALENFTSTGNWYGRAKPDIGFVQLAVRDVPFLNLASEDFYLRVGMRVSTVGYPMGTLPLTMMGKLNQLSPFLRQGIVSSVFPFPVAKPHGFTIDIMQQGGSSGSPIFPLGEKTVVGLMCSSVFEHVEEMTKQGPILIRQNTNISIAEPAHIIKLALEQFRNQHPPTLDGIPTLAELRAKFPQENSGELEWESLGLM